MEAMYDDMMETVSKHIIMDKVCLTDGKATKLSENARLSVLQQIHLLECTIFIRMYKGRSQEPRGREMPPCHGRGQHVMERVEECISIKNKTHVNYPSISSGTCNKTNIPVAAAIQRYLWPPTVSVITKSSVVPSIFEKRQQYLNSGVTLGSLTD
ncbi:hypothetical protein STEG23_026911 [Scotinomys teguina]